MYIWVGCKLPDSFAQEIRSRCLEKNQAIGLDTVAFSLPQHVSLKISFQSERYEEIVAYLAGFLSVQKPFSLGIQQTEQAGSILWMPVAENEVLRQAVEGNRLQELEQQNRALTQQLEALEESFIFSPWERVDEAHTAVRVCTSWCTPEEHVAALIAAIGKL